MLTATDTLTCYSAVTSMRGSDTQVFWGDSTGTYRHANATVFPKVAGNGVVLDIDAGDIDGDGDEDIVLTRTGDGTGALEFYQGYYLQLLEQGGARHLQRRNGHSCCRTIGIPRRGRSTGYAYTIPTAMATWTSWSMTIRRETWCGRTTVQADLCGSRENGDREDDSRTPSAEESRSILSIHDTTFDSGRG